MSRRARFLHYILLFYHWSLFFFFNDPPTTEIYTLSLHDALPICLTMPVDAPASPPVDTLGTGPKAVPRSEEHTSELQSHSDLVCRLLLEKKKKQINQLCQEK